MAKKRVNISIDEELDKEWTEVANQLGWSKSSMINEFLKEAIPYIQQGIVHHRILAPYATKQALKKARLYSKSASC